MNIKRLLRENLIGLKVRVGNKQGNIIDESRNMITIKDEKEETKKFIKNSNTFIIENNKIEGKKLIGKIEERIKKYAR